MFRWSYILPRVVLLLLLAALVHWGLSPLIQFAIVQSGQAATGSRVDVARVRASFWSAQIELEGVEVANPQQTQRNAVQFDRASLSLDRAALFQRRFVVDRGAVHGIRFDTPRRHDGQLPATPPSETSDAPLWQDQQLAEAGKQWLDALGKRLQGQLDEDLKSVRLARELGERWPREYAQLEARARAWEERVQSLRQAAQRPQGNVLEQVEFYQGKLVEIDQVRREVPELYRELERLGGQIQRDRLAVDDARRHDTQYLREQLQLDRWDGEQLSAFLLGEQTDAWAREMLTWVERARMVWGIAGAEPEVNQSGGRGIDVLFGSQGKYPDLLIRHLELDGVIRNGGKELAFAGSAEGLTHQARRHGEPARLVLQTKGDASWQVEAILDYRGEQHRELIQVACPQLPQPQRSLGDDERLAVRIAPGQAVIQIDLELQGSEVDGTLRLVQDDLQLDAQLNDDWGGEYLATGLRSAVRRVHRFESTLHLQGPLRKPQLKLQSDLGNQLAEGFQTAFQQELLRHGQQLEARLEAQIDEQIAAADQLVTQHLARATGRFEIGQQQLEQLKQQLLAQVGSPTRLLGDKIPLPNLFKR